MLSDSELAAIRADVAKLLPNTGQILSSTETSDSQGGFTYTWGTATANIAYRLDPIRDGRQQVGGAALQDYHSFILTLPYDATLTTANRFKDQSGNSYSVISVDKAKSWAASVRAIVEAL